MPKSRITIDLPPEILKQIEKYAEQQGISRNMAITKAISLLLEKVKKEEKNF